MIMEKEETKIVTESSMYLMFGDIADNYDGNGKHRNLALHLTPVVIHYPKRQYEQGMNGFNYVNIFLDN